MTVQYVVTINRKDCETIAVYGIKSVMEFVLRVMTEAITRSTNSPSQRYGGGKQDG